MLVASSWRDRPLQHALQPGQQRLPHARHRLLQGGQGLGGRLRECGWVGKQGMGRAYEATSKSAAPPTQAARPQAHHKRSFTMFLASLQMSMPARRSSASALASAARRARAAAPGVSMGDPPTPSSATARPTAWARNWPRAAAASWAAGGMVSRVQPSRSNAASHASRRAALAGPGLRRAV